MPVRAERLVERLGQLRPRGPGHVRVHGHRGVQPGRLDAQVLLDAVEALRAEEPPQQDAALIRLRGEELGELSLRQQDHLHELLGVQVQDGRDLLADLVRPGERRRPFPVHAFPQGDRGLRGDGGAPRCAASPAGPLVLGRADHLEAPALHGELDLHLGDHRAGLAQRGHERLGRPSARHGPVEGEAQRGQHRGLARAGGPVQQEQAGRVEPVEVDVLRLGVGPEPLQAHPMDPHARTSAARAASRASPSRSCSASLAGRCRTWSTKPTASAWSEGACRRTWA